MRILQNFIERGRGGFDGGMRPGRRQELLGMRKVQTVRGPRFETLGKHDDLVFALALFGLRMRELPVDAEAVRRRPSW